MKVKDLADDKFQVVAVIDNGYCATEHFLTEGDVSTESARGGLERMIEKVAELGLEDVPSAWFHLANKPEKIYEFIKGPLRLFFFKGEGRQIAVCTTGVRKSGPKADKTAVARSVEMRAEYFAAVENKTLQVVSDETE